MSLHTTSKHYHFLVVLIAIILGGNVYFFAKSTADTVNGLLSYWKFDETSGAFASDSSGNNNKGTLLNNITFAQGVSGGAFGFNGANSLVSTPVTTNGKTGSISMWVNPSVALHSGRVYTAFVSGGPGNSISLSFNGYGSGHGNAWEAAVRGGYGNTLNASYFVSEFDATLHGWQHFVMTWDTSKGVNLYINGSLRATKSGTTGTVVSGAQSIGDIKESFFGAIDEVKYFNRELAASDISALYVEQSMPTLNNTVTVGSPNTPLVEATVTTKVIPAPQPFVTPTIVPTSTPPTPSPVPLPPNPTSKTFEEGYATYFGKYEPEKLAGCDQYPTKITDYSKLTYDSTNNQILMFGGGHAAVPRTDVDVLSLSTFSWKSAYAPTPVSELNAANFNKVTGGWNTTGHPMSRHTYDMLTFAPNTGELIMLLGVGSAPRCQDGNGLSSDWLTWRGNIWHYNPVTKKWTPSTASANWGPEEALASEYDPESGKIIIVGRSGLSTYDPVTKIRKLEMNFIKGELSYAQNLVYYPPNKKMYYILSDGTVFEVTLNRSNFALSSINQVTGVTGTLPPRPITGFGTVDASETGWAYDSANKIIGGGIKDGIFYAYNPLLKKWSSEKILTRVSEQVGGLVFHTIDYDPVHNIFVFIGGYIPYRYAPVVFNTWGYRYKGTAGVPSQDPDTIAPTIPTELTATSTAPGSVSLLWKPSTDNFQVTGYQVFRDSAFVATSSGVQFLDSGLSPLKVYRYTVSAFDKALNYSKQSTFIDIKTLGIVTPPATPVVTLSVAQATIILGAQTTLSWSSSNVSSCSASNAWSGARAISGTLVVTPKVTSTYVITCSSQSGQVSSNVTINVRGPSNGQPVAYWALDKFGSDNAAIDYSGNNNFGVLMNRPVWVTGKIGKALSFNGTNSYVSTPVTTNYPAGSISLWVKPDAIYNNAREFKVIEAGGAGNMLTLNYNGYSGTQAWIFTVRGSFGKIMTVNVPATQASLVGWQHIVVTWDISKGITMYINGIQKGTFSGTTGVITNAAQVIGGLENTFLGLIDEVKVYDKVLSDQEIAGLFSSTVVATPPSNATDLMAPTVPANFNGNPRTPNEIELTWEASADNIGVAGYKVYKSGKEIGRTSALSYIDAGLTQNTSYTYSVAAYDAAGNTSSQTEQSTVPTGQLLPKLSPGANGPIPYSGIQPVIPDTALHISESPYTGSTWRMVAYNTAPWMHFGADWRDKNLVLQGQAPWAVSTVKNNATEQTIAFDVTSLIMNQKGTGQNKIPNRGMLVKLVSGTTIVTLYNKEVVVASKRPVLRVTTNQGAVQELYPDADTPLSSSSYIPQGAAESASISDVNYLALWFDLSKLPASITSATLTFTSTAKQYGGASGVLGVFPVDMSETFATIPVKTGIASLYKDDIGIEQDNNVIFMERFLDNKLETRGWGVDKSLKSQIIGDVDIEDANYKPLASGIKAYKMTIPTKTYGGDFGRWYFWSNLGYEPEELYIRTYARMGTDFDSMAGKFPFGFDGTYIKSPSWQRNPVTGRMITRPDAPTFAGNGGATSKGTNGWSARGGFGAQECDSSGNCAAPEKSNALLKSGYRYIDYYTYWADQPETKGSSMPWDKGLLGLIPKNTWFAVDQYVKLNTVNPDGTGNKDGILRVWIDGRLAFEKTDFRVRNWLGNPDGAKNIKLYSLWLNFYHGGLDPANSPMNVYLSNIIVAKKYIGPANAK